MLKTQRLQGKHCRSRWDSLYNEPSHLNLVFANSAIGVFGVLWVNFFGLTFILPLSSADNFGKQFGPRSDPTKRRAWSGSKLFDIQMILLKVSFEKVNFEIISRQRKIMQIYLKCKELKHKFYLGFIWDKQQNTDSIFW